ncbi:MAG: hypothetical protein JST64_02620, partial [Actinobacteria bacterium]|nr:hypothetical protein [Actinomycetota bacterium]
MALTEKSRSALYRGLCHVIDEEAVEEMLSFFPARDVDEAVTREFLRAELAGMELRLAESLRAELRSELRSEVGALRAEMGELRAELRSELQSEIGGLRAELQSEIGGLRAELHSEIGGLR